MPIKGAQATLAIANGQAFDMNTRSTSLTLVHNVMAKSPNSSHWDLPLIKLHYKVNIYIIGLIYDDNYEHIWL